MGYILSLLRLREFSLVASACLLVSGCGLVPKDGPYKDELETKAEVTLQPATLPVGYALVHLSPSVLQALSAQPINDKSLSQLPQASGQQDIRIGVGDTIGLTIFEQDSGGLFIPKDAGSRAGNFVSIPNQEVDKSGAIEVPYAGRVSVAGRTTGAVASEIKSKLKAKAIDPQVVISFGERHGAEVSVLGDVTGSTRFELDPGGIRVLGAIARAGGPKNPPYETVVSIQRGSRTFQSPMTMIVKDPRQNVLLAAGDVVYVSHEPKVFMTLGSTLPPGSVGGINSRRFVFDDDNVSLTEAVSKSGGLNPDRADATAVFIIRTESRQLLAQMGVDVSNYTNALVPTIYIADWSKADAFFLSNRFFMRDKDVVFVSEHPDSDLSKLTNVVRGVTAPFADVGTASSLSR